MRRQCWGTRIGWLGFSEGGTHKETLRPQGKGVTWGDFCEWQTGTRVEGSANGRQGLGPRVLRTGTRVEGSANGRLGLGPRVLRTADRD